MTPKFHEENFKGFIFSVVFRSLLEKKLQSLQILFLFLLN